MALVPPVIGQRSRPSGRIAGGLRPVASVNGIRFQMLGLGHFVGDDDPSFPRAAQELLEPVILADVRAAFKAAGVPILVDSSSPETRPQLSVRVRWHPVGTSFAVCSYAKRLEAARLIRDTSALVWSPTWESGFCTQSSARDLRRTLRSAVMESVSSFLREYAPAYTTR